MELESLKRQLKCLEDNNVEVILSRLLVVALVYIKYWDNHIIN